MHRNVSSSRLAAPALALAACVACSHDQPPAAAPLPLPPASAVPSVRKSPEPLGFLEVTETVKTTCNLPDAPAEAPQFDYDEAEVRPRGEVILDGIANCMLRGPLQGEDLVLIGRADPRGSDAYNLELGRKRAEAVADYLETQGVHASRLVPRSRGEADASGTDPQSWQLDRRVSIDVAPAGGGAVSLQ